MGNICCWKRDRQRGPWNEVRWLEFVMCTTCVIFTIVASEKKHFKTSGAYILFYIVPIMYLFITFYDMLVICAYYPIGWRAWILLSTSATLMFVLCAGMSPIILASWWFVYTIVYIITAIVFLVDALCIVRLVALHAANDQKDLEDCCNPFCNTKFSQVVPLNAPVEHDYAQTRDTYDYQEEEELPIRHHHKHHRNPRHRSSECSYQHKQISQVTATPSTSYEIEFERQMQSYSASFSVRLDSKTRNKPFVVDSDQQQRQAMSLGHCAGDMVVELKRSRNTAPVSRIPTMKQLKFQDIDLTPLKSPFTEKERNKIHSKQVTTDIAYDKAVS